MRRATAVAALAAASLLLAASATGRESGLAVGAHAPPLNGGKWVSADGAEPDMKDKVLLIEFWFDG